MASRSAVGALARGAQPHPEHIHKSTHTEAPWVWMPQPMQAWALLEREQGNLELARRLFKRGSEADPSHLYIWQARFCVWVHVWGPCVMCGAPASCRLRGCTPLTWRGMGRGGTLWQGGAEQAAQGPRAELVSQRLFLCGCRRGV